MCQNICRHISLQLCAVAQYTFGADNSPSQTFSFFSRFRIKPRILQGISGVDMSLLLFGERISMPICMASVGVQAMANTMAEMASAQGIQREFIC